MCGFVLARASDPGISIDPVAFARTLRTLAVRGPDDEGTLIENGLALGFRRLAIIDLTQASRQPMSSADGRYSILYNGEIYNYRELRVELEACGHVFRSTGDSEVLLNAFVAWGLACVSRLNGMWAFVVVDHKTGCIHGARDRFGIKPLFYTRNDAGIVFASEIKAILATGEVAPAPNDPSVARWLLEGRMEEGDETFVAGIARVPAGHAFTVAADGRLTFHRYWSLAQAVESERHAQGSDLPDAFSELFEDSVRLTLRSDVPVGVLLSGGLDSTAIYGACSRLLGENRDRVVAFSYVPEEFGEAPLVRDTITSHGGRLAALELSPEAIWETLPSLLECQDEPVHSMTAAVGFRLYALAREHAVPVVLIGQGADETLGGYPSYFQDYWHDLLGRGSIFRLTRELRAYGEYHKLSIASLLAPLLVHAIKSRLRHLTAYRTLADRRRIRRLTSVPWANQRLVTAFDVSHQRQPFDLSGTLRHSVESDPLPLYLRMEDRSSMAHSIEARLPFLDHRLVTLALASDDSWKLSGPLNKYLLRTSMSGRIPESVRTRVEKLGFPTSFSSWLRGPIGKNARSLIGDCRPTLAPFVDSEQVIRLLDQHQEGSLDAASVVFDCAQLAIWLDQLSARSQAGKQSLFTRNSSSSVSFSDTNVALAR